MRANRILQRGWCNVAMASLVAVTTMSILSSSASASIGLATSPVVNVWTEPASGYGFLDAAIDSARHGVDLSMYELSDLTIERALIARANAGVDVRVLLNADYGGTSHNAAAYALLRASKVHVAWAPADQIFHAKYLVLDSRVAYVGTGNLETIDYASTRDFWVEDDRASDVEAIARTFDADFAGAGATVPSGGLVWSPGSTATLVDLIDGAKRSLLVENEEMDSTAIESALRSAARRGVTVKVVMTESSSWTGALDALAAAGVHVRLLGSSQVYVHAKVICVDCVSGAGTVFIGSENFSTSSLSYNRELGVITTSPRAVLAVETAVDGDYAHGANVAGGATPTPTKNGGGPAITVTSFERSIGPGDEDSLSVHTSRADESCDLTITLPSGYTSESRGLGATRTDGAGDATWTWEIGPSTDPGTARATITCTVGTLEKSFQIR